MESQLKLAGLLYRFCSHLIDLLIITALVDGTIALFIENPSVVSILFLIIQSCYHAFTESARWQASPGQRIMNIYIARKDHKKIDFMFALDRYLSQVLLVVLLMMSRVVLIDMFDVPWAWTFGFVVVNIAMIVWYGFALFNDDRQTFHDLLFGTVVVQGRL